MDGHEAAALAIIEDPRASLQFLQTIFIYADGEPRTLLILAAHKGLARVVTALLQRGADATEFIYGRNAVTTAVASGQVGVVRSLLTCSMQERGGALTNSEMYLHRLLLARAEVAAAAGRGAAEGPDLLSRMWKWAGDWAKALRALGLLLRLGIGVEQIPALAALALPFSPLFLLIYWTVPRSGLEGTGDANSIIFVCSNGTAFLMAGDSGGASSTGVVDSSSSGGGSKTGAASSIAAQAGAKDGTSTSSATSLMADDGGGASSSGVVNSSSSGGSIITTTTTISNDTVFSIAGEGSGSISGAPASIAAQTGAGDYAPGILTFVLLLVIALYVLFSFFEPEQAAPVRDRGGAVHGKRRKKRGKRAGRSSPPADAASEQQAAPGGTDNGGGEEQQQQEEEVVEEGGNGGLESSEQQQRRRAKKRKARRRRGGAETMAAAQAADEGEGEEQEECPTAAPQAAAATAAESSEGLDEEKVEGEATALEGEEEDEEALALAAAEQHATNALICPMSLVLLTDPVVGEDGHVYQRGALEEWISRCQAGMYSQQKVGCGACITATRTSDQSTTVHTPPTSPVGRPLTSPKTQLPMGPAIVPCHNVKALVAESIEEQRAVIRRRREEEQERQRQQEKAALEAAVVVPAAAVAEEGGKGSWFGFGWLGGRESAKAKKMD